MPKKRPSNISLVSVRVRRDALVQRALNAVHSIVFFAGPRVSRIYSGGGVHVGPPKGKNRRAVDEDFICDFSVDPAIASDLLVKVLGSILGGKSVTYMDSGNEWRDLSIEPPGP